MTTIQRFRLAAAAACTLLVSVTCKAGDDEFIRVNESSIAHGFALTDIEGLDHRLGDYKDQVVLITFWASWCPLCLWEMPALEQLWIGLGGDGLVLLGINVGEDAGLVADFASAKQLSFPLLLDTDLNVYRTWPVLGLPTSFLVGREGKPVYKAVGALDWLDETNLARVCSLLFGRFSAEREPTGNTLCSTVPESKGSKGSDQR